MATRKPEPTAAAQPSIDDDALAADTPTEPGPLPAPAPKALSLEERVARIERYLAAQGFGA